MKHIKLNLQERAIENALAKGSLEPVKNLGTIKTKLQKAAASALNRLLRRLACRQAGFTPRNDNGKVI
ncbi:MAG: hypothetical protein Q7S14_03610 [bacterium]|nr:hypothetical protein [bacterium]